MTDTRPHLEPGADHPISVTSHAGTVVVRAGDAEVARTTRALDLQEASYPPVLYIPIDDVDRRLLHDSDRHTWCPYKGEASYYDLTATGDGSVWYYPDPLPAVGAIRDHVAFYADRVEITANP